MAAAKNMGGMLEPAKCKAAESKRDSVTGSVTRCWSKKVVQPFAKVA